MAMIGMFSAISTILMILELPVFFTPGFYKLDFSELPALIGGFAFGPVAGIMIEFCKILLKLMTKGTSTALVGELANFVVGCSFILPASCLYWLKKSKKSAIFSSIVGTLCMTVVGSWLNAVFLLPTSSVAVGIKEIESFTATTRLYIKSSPSGSFLYYILIIIFFVVIAWLLRAIDRELHFFNSVLRNLCDLNVYVLDIKLKARSVNGY